ncbi:MAG: class I mannose-6-phosphate isomerase [Ginsengibacter sp.]
MNYEKDMGKAQENINTINGKWRKSSQSLLPLSLDYIPKCKEGEYNIYPFHSLGDGQIHSGYTSLANWIAEKKMVGIDGYFGNDWAVIRKSLDTAFRQKKLNVFWYEISLYARQEEEIEEMIKPFLGEPGSVWGTKTTLKLDDFFNISELENLRPNENSDIVILIGVGAGLCKQKMPLIYVDLPKNELQYRMRAGSAFNLCGSKTSDSLTMYKRFYFVDSVVMNTYRQRIKDNISVIADGQWKENINWALHSSVLKGLSSMSQNVIRVRPWFEAGTWGGQWMKEHIPSLCRTEINYAWSFELIVPENGLLFESDQNLLEVSFDWIMESFAREILGGNTDRFGIEFPIRFDFLDTFDGGNLSIQCHPSLNYIQKKFGEKLTQDEAYYIMDCQKDAGVYLGFQDDIDPETFREELEESEKLNIPVKIEKYIKWFKSHKHDFFLIPNGTVHSSGRDNLVLEISATPYIFTFKMYDWVRPDLNGKYRPINIEHAFNNLNFARKGNVVERDLISFPKIIDEDGDFRIMHLPTHAEHFYDVHRIEFVKEITIKTNDQFHVLMIVEGSAVIVKTKKGASQRFNYAETFIIPAAAESYQLINESGKLVKVIKAFIK